MYGLFPFTGKEKILGGFFGMTYGAAGKLIRETEVASLGAEHVSIPSLVIYHHPSSGKPGFDGHLDALGTPTPEVFIANV